MDHSFLAESVPKAGPLDSLNPFDAIQQAKGGPGGKIYLMGHWRNAPQGGVTATHVHGFRTREVPIALPKDLKLLAAKAQQNSRLGAQRLLRSSWRPTRWTTRPTRSAWRR